MGFQQFPCKYKLLMVVIVAVVVAVLGAVLLSSVSCVSSVRIAGSVLFGLGSISASVGSVGSVGCECR